MLLKISSSNFTSFGNSAQTASQRERNKERVEDAAVVTGGVGAGVTATRSAAFKMFNSSAKLNKTINAVAEGAQAITQPVSKSKSLWNALKLNYRKLTGDIARWAKNSKAIPGFLKPLFTGKLASIFGGVAAVFVFITGLAEVIENFAKKITEVANNSNKNSET